MKLDFQWPKDSLKILEEKLKNQKEKRINFDTKNEHKIKNLLELKDRKMKDQSISFSNMAKNFVFGDGNPDSKIMMIGEAPGEEEDNEGLPFVGRSGKLLRYFLKEAQIDDFYITNVVSWRPPNNRTPTLNEINAMKPYIFEHIKIVSPKVIVTVGTTALKALGINQTITKAQGNLIKTELGLIYPIYHPSYALRVSNKKKELWQSLLKLKIIISDDIKN